MSVRISWIKVLRSQLLAETLLDDQSEGKLACSLYYINWPIGVMRIMICIVSLLVV